MATGTRSIAIVGGGLGGVGALCMLERAGYSDVTLFEKGPRLGGVWAQNTYPGAACDVPSHLYEYSFAPNPRWSRRYAPQAEIQEYVEQTARSHGVTERARCGVEVRAASWDDGASRWTIETSEGSHTADVLLTACGQLSTPSVPPLEGLDTFAGPAFHTAQWDNDLDVTGKRVAVVGTGCSAIQTVPAIAPIAAHVDVYQRSPGWTFPKMDYAYSERAQALFERFPWIVRADRASIQAFMELGALAMTSRPALLKPFQAIARRQITKAIKDPQLRRDVTPSDVVGCKRLMLTDEWYPTLARPDVDLITDRISEIVPEGVRTQYTGVRPADVLVLATGFKSHGFVAPMEITGAGGRTLAQEWDGVPHAYLGSSVPGFPNMFLLYGPNTNGGTGSVIYTLEASITHVIAALRELDARDAAAIEVRREVSERFNAGLRAALADSVWHTGCTNWYVDPDGNDPSQWPWLWSQFRKRTASLEHGAYELS